MLPCRQFVVRFGEIVADRAFRTPENATRNEARNATCISTCFATRFATRFATFRQFSTMFVRASFARGISFRGNEIRRRRRPQSSGQMVKLLKNVEILVPPLRTRKGQAPSAISSKRGATVARLRFADAVFPISDGAKNPARIYFDLVASSPTWRAP